LYIYISTPSGRIGLLFHFAHQLIDQKAFIAHRFEFENRSAQNSEIR
jgi:hypothetical protein